MQVNVKYRSWSWQDSEKLQNNASSHYATTIFTLCIYFLQYETPLFRIHVFRTRRLIHTPSLSWLQNLNFKLGALGREKRRGLAFYTRTSCKDSDMLCNSDGLHLINITKDHYMDQLLTFPTRGDKTLDLIFLNSPGIANNCYNP